MSEINENRLCKNYKMFKKELGVSKYLLELDFFDRLNLTRFRCGNHKLPVANNRYSDAQGHIHCTRCNNNDEADEYHYTLVCPSFSSLRELYIKRYYFTRPNSLKFEQLFNAESKKQMCKIC